MNKIAALIFMLLAVMACNTNNSSQEDGGLSKSEHLVNATLWFQQSAEMEAVFYQSYELAKYRLLEKQKNYKGEKTLAVVLDIDETVLDNSPYEVELIEKGTNYASDTWKLWCDKGIARALPGALEFTQWAQKYNIEVFYISNRRVNVLEATLKNLQELNFPNADEAHVLLRGVEESGDKTARRSKVEENHHVALYIGDNLTDYQQKYAHRDSLLGINLLRDNLEEVMNNFIALPNPMYGEWESAVYDNNFSISSDEKRALRKEALIGME